MPTDLMAKKVATNGYLVKSQLRRSVLARRPENPGPADFNGDTGPWANLEYGSRWQREHHRRSRGGGPDQWFRHRDREQGLHRYESGLLRFRCRTRRHHNPVPFAWSASSARQGDRFEARPNHRGTPGGRSVRRARPGPSDPPRGGHGRSGMVSPACQVEEVPAFPRIRSGGSGVRDRGERFRFSIGELNGALGDLGTLLPLMLGAIFLAGLAPVPVVLGFARLLHRYRLRVPAAGPGPADEAAVAAVLLTTGGDRSRKSRPRAFWLASPFWFSVQPDGSGGWPGSSRNRCWPVCSSGLGITLALMSLELMGTSPPVAIASPADPLGHVLVARWLPAALLALVAATVLALAAGGPQPCSCRPA